MAKVTSKLQVTIPKAIAELYGIEPGDEIEFQPAGDIIRVVPARGLARRALSVEEKLRLFDESMARQRERWTGVEPSEEAATDRGWTRDDLHDRERSR